MRAPHEGPGMVALEIAMDELAVELDIDPVELRLRDYARIDLRVSAGGEIYVIEVNPNCYLERESEFARAAHKSGLEYQDLIARIVQELAAELAPTRSS